MVGLDCLGFGFGECELALVDCGVLLICVVWFVMVFVLILMFPVRFVCLFILAPCLTCFVCFF